MRCTTEDPTPPGERINVATSPELKYLDRSLSIDVRVDDLVSRMTLEEKVSQMTHDAPAIERLGIPPYNWW
jgi:beta-glucosidase